MALSVVQLAIAFFAGFFLGAIGTKIAERYFRENDGG